MSSSRIAYIASYGEEAIEFPGHCQQLHFAKKPNEVVQMDFFNLGTVQESDLKYVSVLKDDHSSYTWLLPFASPDSEATADVLTR